MTKPLSRNIKILLFLGLITFAQVALFILLHNKSDILTLSKYFPSKNEEEHELPLYESNPDPEHETEKENAEEVVPVVVPPANEEAYSYIMKENVTR
jgi:hypothetical protein